jgi:hypothetical protein
MNSKETNEFMMELAMLEHDLKCFKELMALDAEEQAVLAELNENQEKLSALLEDPTEENKDLVIEYLKTLAI